MTGLFGSLIVRAVAERAGPDTRGSSPTPPPVSVYARFSSGRSKKYADAPPSIRMRATASPSSATFSRGDEARVEIAAAHHDRRDAARLGVEQDRLQPRGLVLDRVLVRVARGRACPTSCRSRSRAPSLRRRPSRTRSACARRGAGRARRDARRVDARGRRAAAERRVEVRERAAERARRPARRSPTRPGRPARAASAISVAYCDHLARRDARVDARREPAAGVEHHARPVRLRAQPRDLAERRDQRAVGADLLQREVGARRLAGGVAADREPRGAGRQVDRARRRARRRGGLVAEPEDRRGLDARAVGLAGRRRARRSRCRRRPAHRSSRPRPSPSRRRRPRSRAPGRTSAAGRRRTRRRRSAARRASRSAVSRSTKPSGGSGKAGSSGSGWFGSTAPRCRRPAGSASSPRARARSTRTGRTRPPSRVAAAAITIEPGSGWSENRHGEPAESRISTTSRPAATAPPSGRPGHREQLLRAGDRAQQRVRVLVDPPAPTVVDAARPRRASRCDSRPPAPGCRRTRSA